MKIRAKFDLGVCHGYEDVKRGDVIDIDEFNALRYLRLGYAEPVREQSPPVERAVLPEPEKAVVEVVGEDTRPKPLDEDPKPRSPGRPPGRPRR